MHHQVHHPTTLVHVVCLCHLLSCLRARVYVFFRNRIESYNRYTCNMQETWKSMLQPELASLLSRSLSIFRARLHVCLLQQEWWQSRLSVRLQGRLHCRYQPSFTICNMWQANWPPHWDDGKNHKNPFESLINIFDISKYDVHRLSQGPQV